MTSNSLILEVIIFIGSAGSGDSHKLWGKEIFIGGIWLQSTVESLDVQWLDG